MKRLLLAIIATIVIVGLAVTFIFVKKPAENITEQTVVKTAVATPPSTPAATPNLHEASVSGPLADINVSKLISVAAADGLKPKALKAALNSYAWAREHGKVGSNQNTLTVVDFTLPSYTKRMWVLDLKSNKVLMKLYTTHGKGSGETYATRFSNRDNSLESSLGLYVTSDEYYGRHDKSMQINGLEKGINNNARSRSIVIHSAYYATPEYIREHHGAGRSWGCFAVAPEVKNQLLDNIKGGSVLFTYAQPEDHDPIVSNGPMQI